MSVLCEKYVWDRVFDPVMPSETRRYRHKTVCEKFVISANCDRRSLCDRAPRPRCPVPDWATKGDFTSITRTADELSIVCATDNLPPDVRSPHRWICLKLEGPFRFSQTGVLLSFIEPLSNNNIPIFAISTYDTDYVLVQEQFLEAALDVYFTPDTN